MTSSSAPRANAFVAKMLSICSECPSRTGEALTQRILIGTAPLSSTGGVGVGVSDDVIESSLQHNTMQLCMPAVAVIGLVFSVGLNVAHLVKQGGLGYVLFFVLDGVQPDEEAAIGLFLGLAVSLLGESSPDDDSLGEFAVPVLTIVGVKDVLHLARGVRQGGRFTGRGGLFNLLRMRGQAQSNQQQDCQQASHLSG